MKLIRGRFLFEWGTCRGGKDAEGEAVREGKLTVRMCMGQDRDRMCKEPDKEEDRKIGLVKYDGAFETKQSAYGLKI